LGQGKEKAVEFLTQNPDLLDDIRQRVMGELKLGKQPHRSDPYAPEKVGAGDGGKGEGEDALEA